MVFNKYENGFNQCDPPVCAEDIQVEILDITCTESKQLTVSWIIQDVYNRDFGFLSTNRLLWSCNNDTLNNTINNYSEDSPYKTIFDISSCEGVVYYQVELRIRDSLFKSDVLTFDLNNCGTSTGVIPASWCGNAPGGFLDPPSFNLYVKNNAIPYRPVYFKYGGRCWKVNSTDRIVSEDSILSGVILDDIGTVFDNCSECFRQGGCPGTWEVLPESAQTFEGERVGTFYFEYQTYYCPDRLKVLKNYEADSCDIDNLPAEQILFDTGCVSTSLNEGSDFTVTSRKCITREDVTKGFCVDVRESELPLAIVNDCDCSDSCNTLWKICAITPDGDTFSWEGGNECLCAEVEPEPPVPPVPITEWTEVAPSIGQTGIWQLETYNNKLYAASSWLGQLLEWDVGETAWTVAAPLKATEQLIKSLVVYDNGVDGEELYAGTGQNATAGGRLLKWKTEDAEWSWVCQFRTEDQYTIESLVVFNNKIYGGTGGGIGNAGLLFEWEPGETSWSRVAYQFGSERFIYDMVVYNNGSGEKIYAGTWPNGYLLSWDGDNPSMSWTEEAPSTLNGNAIYSLAIYDNGDGNGEKLYGGSANGTLYRWNDADSWVAVAPYLHIGEDAFSLAVYDDGTGNGEELYTGTVDGPTTLDARLLKWNKVDAWEIVINQISTVHEIRALGVFKGKLYAGTSAGLPINSGRLLRAD